MFIVGCLCFIGFSSFIYYKNKETINTSYQLYKLYKQTLDPDEKFGHYYTLKSIINLFFKKNKDKPIEQFNKKYLKISYRYKDKDYFYLLKIPKGIIPLRSVQDEKGNNIEDILSPYLGPNLDCHGVDIFPKDFGYEKVKITTVFDRIITFEENDKIVL